MHHDLPFWFLVLALFLPRIAVGLMWLRNALGPFHLDGLLPPIAWVILPRALVMYLIYLDRGIELWFLLHLIVAVSVWGGSGRYHTQRRNRNNFA